ncbi:MAG: hypothetical protein KatS3mg109_0021 [Pirellulaceae bacterium]|nr:MAG: hypothetical protein KatS3mg109_0021 [Pirellulaceae bacterium]
MALVFTNNQRQVLWYRTPKNPVVGSFVIPSLSNQALQMVITSIRVQPNPVYQIHSTIGGFSYISVFGEDPVLIDVSAVIGGSSGCVGLFNPALSAMAKAVRIFSRRGIVGYPVPLRFSIAGIRSRASYLVGMTISQDNAFSDVVSVDLKFVAEPFSEVRSLAALSRDLEKAGKADADAADGDVGGESDRPIVSPTEAGSSNETATVFSFAVNQPIIGDIPVGQPAGLAISGYDGVKGIASFDAISSLPNGDAESAGFVEVTAEGYSKVGASSNAS